MPIDRSPAGAWTYENKAGNAFQRSPGLKQELRLGSVNVLTPLGMAPLIKFPAERANRYLTRITKGLLTHIYPELDYSLADFVINAVKPCQQIVDEVLPKFFGGERGDRVFRYWYGPDSDNPQELGAVWVFVFYDVLMFNVSVNGLKILEGSNNE